MNRTGFFALVLGLAIAKVTYADGGIAAAGMFVQLMIIFGILIVVSIPTLIIAYLNKGNPKMKRAKFVILLLPALVAGGSCLYFAWAFYPVDFRMSELFFIFGIPGVILFGPTAYLMLRYARLPNETPEAKIVALVEIELGDVVDPRVIAHIRSLLVEPTMLLRRWDYGETGTCYACWTVFAEQNSDVGIAYCADGFGPENPWGLIRLSGTENEMSMGMDCGWFPTFIEAYFESAACELPIWRVFKQSDGGLKVPISDEGSWDSIWARVMTLREQDETVRYDCSHTIDHRSRLVESS